MFKLSPFTPIFFSPTSDRFGVKSKYVQTFAQTDCIMIELLATGDHEEAPALTITNLCTGLVSTVVWSKWKINQSTTLFFNTIRGLDVGRYIMTLGGFTSEPFRVTDDAMQLSTTTLIQYSMPDNKVRSDAVWWVNGMQYFFDFRVPGGFKDDNWVFGVSNEQFTTADQDVLDIYSYDYTQKTFTLGNQIGCPVWYAELLNKILCCQYVYFDGIRYVRAEGSVPEANIEIENLRSYIFTQTLQRVTISDPFIEDLNQLRMRRVADDNYRIASSEGEMSKNLIIL